MSDVDLTDLVGQVSAWIAHDPDPATRAEAEGLLARALASDHDAAAHLADAFGGRLAFGTAGLRAELGAGPQRMNRVVVAQTSAGFAEFLWQRARAGATTTPPTVVIGYDARVNSDIFARDAAEIMAGAGLVATLLPGPLPTPVTAFAVRHLGASAGVMITASHNPPRDNGYKVYLGDADDGAQIAPPTDAAIAACIDAAATGPVSELPRRPDAVLHAGGEIVEAYVAEAAGALGSEVSRDAAAAPGPRVVYTAMHGVGSAVAQRVFRAAGLPEVVPVASQDAPDGSFPTVSFPNPEEDGALDLAIATAREHGADLILANDPDADRLAIAAPHPDEPSGYRRLTGNQLGLLLGWRAAERAARTAVRDGRPLRGTLANTIVSSPALGAVADAYGLEHVETLSGFKWVARVPNLIFGFEEALGYLTHPTIVHDKDGITAAADALAMARELHAAGRTVWELLDEASARFGYFASAQIVVRFSAAAEAASAAARIRENPPTAFGGVQVRRVRDFLDPGHAVVPADVLAFDLEDGSRLMIRPSGTEPKLKAYLDANCRTGTIAERRAAAETAVGRLASALHTALAEVRA